MDFAFSEEQQMLRSQARTFLAERTPPERVAELAESEQGWDRALYEEMAGLGWTGLSVPEDLGGAGMGFIDEAVLFEELGYALYPGPYFATVALGLPAIEGHPDKLKEVAAGTTALSVAWAEPARPYLTSADGAMETTARRSGDGWTLTGEKELVCDGASADEIAVLAASDDGVGIWLVRSSEESVTCKALSTMDSTRRLARVSLSGAEGAILVEPGREAATIRRTELRALSALALEAVGVAQRSLELATDYAKQRRQFEKPIGSYQAVSHKVAETYVETELARSLAYWAAWCVAEGDPQAAVAAPAAKAFGAETAVKACESSIQVHGGIGFTWEHVLHRYYKRAQWIDSFEGFGARHRETVTASLIDSGD
jgi:alkylation response protein AidB-like acyl-CoA dehydrogenase